MEQTPVARRYDVDWLRVVATYLLFVFHGGMVFNPAPFYHIRNAELSFSMLVLCGFLSLWHMPLFFLLAGWSAFGSLHARGPRAFAGERGLRLAIPLVIGCVLFGPAIKYVELRSRLDLSHTGLRVRADLLESCRQVVPAGLAVAPPFDERFLEFLPTFFTRLDRFTWAHLWFLAYLFTFSMLYRPLFSWLMARRGALARPRPTWVYLPIIPLVLIQVTMRPRWPGIQNLYDDWANVAYYSVYLLAGFLLASQPAPENTVCREWRQALGISLGALGVLLAAVLGAFTSPLVLLAGSAVAGWCFVVALLGLARTFLAFTNGALAYLTESALPVYILHQAAIVFAGYGIIRLGSGIAPKYALLLLASATTTLAVYHFLVRRFTITRFMFGMKPAAPPARRAPAPARTAAGVACALVGLGLASGASASAPIGLWYAEGGAAKVQIDRCGDALCGRVVWLRSPLDEDGCELRDRSNPDQAMRQRSVLGLDILRGLRQSPDEPSVWTGGTIYDPTTGRTYRCRLTADRDRLELRGYVGVPLLGRTTSWFRVGTESRTCGRRHMAEAQQ